MIEVEGIQGGNIAVKSKIRLSSFVKGGSMIAGIYEDNSWSLFFEQGGEWNAFLDDERHNKEWVEDWMAESIRDAVRELESILIDEKSIEDLEWFLDWAEDAENTITNAEVEA